MPTKDELEKANATLRVNNQKLRQELKAYKDDLQEIYDLFLTPINVTAEDGSTITTNNLGIIKEKQGELDSVYQNLLGDEENDSVVDRILGQEKTVNETINNINSRVDEFRRKTHGTVKYKDLKTGEEKNYYGDSDPNHPKSTHEFIDREIGLFDKIKSELNIAETNRAEDEKEAKALKNQINSLLPGATSAGLASAFYDAKRDYSPIYLENSEELEKIEKAQTTKGDTTFIVLKSIGFILKTLLLYSVFIIPLLIVAFPDLVNNVFDVKIPVTPFSAEEPFMSLVYKIISGAPWFVISWFGYNSIMSNKKLYEEYNHKQRVMQLYKGFEEKIDQVGKEEQKQKLLNVMLDAVAHRPSLIVPKELKMPIEKGADTAREQAERLTESQQDEK